MTFYTMGYMNAYNRGFFFRKGHGGVTIFGNFNAECMMLASSAKFRWRIVSTKENKAKDQ